MSNNQLIIVVEADEKSRSDFIYINSYLNKQYNIRLNNNIKISSVFMGGKSNYRKPKIIKDINSYISKYKQIGKSHVIYCFDTDDYESDYDRKKELDEEFKFCNSNGYKFVWFCHDIEEVFLGKTVDKSLKTKTARAFLASNGIENVNMKSFKHNSISKKKSNLKIIVDECLKD